MLKYLQKRFALSEKGARDFLNGVLFTTLQNLSLMLTALLIFLFLKDYLPLVLGLTGAASHGLWYYVAMGVLFMAVMYTLAILQYRSTYISVYDESATRRISLAEKLRKLPLAFFGRKNLSDLTATIMEDNTVLEHTFSHAVPQLFAAFISLTFVAIGLFFYHWILALALFWVVPLALIITVLSRHLSHKGHEAVYQTKRAVTEHIQQGLENMREIKAYHLASTYLTQLDQKTHYYEQRLVKGELMAGVIVNSSQSVLKLGLATVIFAGAALLAAGRVDLMTYLIFLIIGSRIYNPIDEVLNNLAALFFLDIRIRRMNEMEAMPVQEGNTAFCPSNYDLVFDAVNFAYDQEGPNILTNVSFTARQGEVTALVGPSGSGKSTLTKLAARFWDIQQGKIMLGGHDISEVDPETLLQSYSVIFQEVVLFNASVMDNIRLGRRHATDEEVIQMARLAQCDDFIRKMPNGYHTVIGENGETLSGGERQRISIARALLKDAPIVLLDEATAALDAENETKIQAALSALIRHKTVLIIAHRMRTVMQANKVVVLEHGRVIETGAPDVLKKQHGLFTNMVQRQMA